MWLDVPRVLRKAFLSTRNNALKRGIEFHLTKQDLADLWEMCGGVCSVSGLPFDLNNRAYPGWTRNPWRPSIDRVDSRVGYLPSNCQIVCVIANIAMNEWGLKCCVGWPTGY